MFLLQKSIEIGQVKRIKVFKTSNLNKEIQITVRAGKK